MYLSKLSTEFFFPLSYLAFPPPSPLLRFLVLLPSSISIPLFLPPSLLNFLLSLLFSRLLSRLLFFPTLLSYCYPSFFSFWSSFCAPFSSTIASFFFVFYSFRPSSLVIPLPVIFLLLFVDLPLLLSAHLFLLVYIILFLSFISSSFSTFSSSSSCFPFTSSSDSYNPSAPTYKVGCCTKLKTWSARHILAALKADLEVFLLLCLYQVSVIPSTST